MSLVSTHNRDLFDELRALRLEEGGYAITGSGPLGIRGLRDMNDIDIIVSDEYWNKLFSSEALIESDGLVKLRLSDNIEALYSGSYGSTESSLPSVEEQIEQAELIGDLPFVCLTHLKLFKGLSAREKDIQDLELLAKFL